MQDIRVGTWNAWNAFGNETLSEQRLTGALEVVKRIDVDVLAIQELAHRGVHSASLESERLEKITALMSKEGYTGRIAHYSPDTQVRDAHFMSLWSRIEGTGAVSRHTYGQRYGLELALPDVGAKVYGVHLDDNNPQERIRSAQALLARVNASGEAIVMGDFNDMHRDSPDARRLRAFGKVIGRFEVDDYYDFTKRFQRIAGKAIRVCKMAEGRAMSEFMAAGFRDADPLCQPTFAHRLVGCQLDHILGSAGITIGNFIIHARSVRLGGEPLSDHFPLSATIRR